MSQAAAPPTIAYTAGAAPTATYSGTQPNLVVIQPANLQSWQPSPFRDYPVRVQCQHCAREGMTVLEYEVGRFTYAVACMICLVGFSWGAWCCCIPCCLKQCKDVIHKCPNCNMTVGSFVRIKK